MSGPEVRTPGGNRADAETLDAINPSDFVPTCTDGQVLKDFATVRAEAAMHGITVCRVADDSGALNYLVGKWSWSRSCKTLDEVRTLVDRMGGAR